jgi:hypothetical protein
VTTYNARVDYRKLGKKKMKQTTRQVLQERQNAPLILPSSEESLNSTSLANNRNNVNTPVDNSKHLLHSVSGCNLRGTGLFVSKVVKSTKSHIFNNESQFTTATRLQCPLAT